MFDELKKSTIKHFKGIFHFNSFMTEAGIM